MVPTLRNLSLLKVSSLHSVYKEDLPSELIDDLRKVKVFNGHFNFDSEGKPGSNAQQVAISIHYDGASWTFASCCQSFPFLCCFDCDNFQPQVPTTTRLSLYLHLVVNCFKAVMIDVANSCDIGVFDISTGCPEKTASLEKNTFC